MAKKLTPAQRRAMDREAKMEKIRLAQKANGIAQGESPIDKTNVPDEKKIKSAAKAAGLKSVFTLAGQDILMTSYGEGNNAILEKNYKDGSFKYEKKDPEKFTACHSEKVFQLRGAVAATTDDPFYRTGNMRSDNSRQDLINCKQELELQYYGETFADNIHIQIIHNILDIEKILAVYANNIIFELDNILHREPIPEAPEGYFDLIGNLSVMGEYDEFHAMGNKNKDGETSLRVYFDEFIKRKQLGYFGNGFYETGYDTKAEKKKSPRKSEKDIYYTLCLLGMTRQALAHGNDRNLDKTENKPDERMNVSLYTLDEKFDNSYHVSTVARQSVRKLLDRTYRNRVRALNDSFIKYTGKELRIIFDAFAVNDLGEKAKYARDYYDFTVRKTYKNIGFSVTRIREMILAFSDREIQRLRGTSFDSVRSKMYRLFDFIIFQYYKDSEEKAAVIKALREAQTEKEKEQIYKTEAEKLWPIICDAVMNHLVPSMNGDVISQMEADPDLSPEMLGDAILPEKASYFSELIYLLTLFLDGKEINDLLTTLSNKFDNITSFLRVLQDENMPEYVSKKSFVERYSLFEKSDIITEELRAITSFARMETPDASAKKVMYIEAVKILGAAESEDDLEQYVGEMLGEEEEKQSEETATKDTGRKIDKGVRNFIANNVIKSSRFKYLVRYNNAENVRNLAGNYAVVKYVLDDIPKEQIVRYYNSCMRKDVPYNDDMRQELAKMINKLSFADFKNIPQLSGKVVLMDEREYEEATREVEKKKAIVRLYLTVLYTLTKNLVNINSRYFMAFHCYERDTELYKRKKKKIEMEPDITDAITPAKSYATLTKTLCRDHYSKRVHGYLQQNMNNSDEWMILQYRNQIEHLNAIRNACKYIGDCKIPKNNKPNYEGTTKGVQIQPNAYFAIFHYVIQRALFDRYSEEKDSPIKSGKTKTVAESINPQILTYFALVEKHHTYCKDFVKALNVPFAYNLPRYKNLSIEGLFDMNRPGNKKATIVPTEE